MMQSPRVFPRYAFGMPANRRRQFSRVCYDLALLCSHSTMNLWYRPEDVGLTTSKQPLGGFCRQSRVKFLHGSRLSSMSAISAMRSCSSFGVSPSYIPRQLAAFRKLNGLHPVGIFLSQTCRNPRCLLHSFRPIPSGHHIFIRRYAVSKC